MLKEIGLATGLLGKAFDLFKADDKKTDGTEGAMSFGSVMAGNGIQVSHLPLSKPLGKDGGLDAVTSDKMDADTKAALDYLHDMTAGGLEAAMKKAMQKIRDKVMAEMGVSQESLDAMEPAAKAAMEAKIAEEVQKRIKEAMGANGTETAEENESFAAKLLEMAKAYKNDVSIV